MNKDETKTSDSKINSTLLFQMFPETENPYMNNFSHLWEKAPL